MLHATCIYLLVGHLYRTCTALCIEYIARAGGTGRLEESFLAIRGIGSHCGNSAPDAPALSRCHLAVRQADRLTGCVGMEEEE